MRLLLPKDVPIVNEDDPKSGRVAEVIAKAKAESRKSFLAKMWANRKTSVPINVFDFTVSRHRDGPDLLLIDHDYRGALLGDCYGANTGIYVRSNGLVVHAVCPAHAPRKAGMRWTTMSRMPSSCCDRLATCTTSKTKVSA